MVLNTSAPWHKASFDRFLDDRLPQLLADRTPLADYSVEQTGRYTCRIRLTFTASEDDVEMEYTDIPQPDEEGIFDIKGKHYGKHYVVVPFASQEELDVAEIRCVGEQLYEYIEQRLGTAPSDLPWDASLAKTWVPLDTWVQGFLDAASQEVQQTNWLDTRTHLRRVYIMDHEKAFAPGSLGRTCPFETPEGPNIGRVLSIAVGAEIRDGKLVIVDDRPEAALGLSTSCVPFLEHNDPNRQLMGVNMMRQWLVPLELEPALVQTGNEPDVPEFWCGYNLLTAFISLGLDTFEDGIVISESCAERLKYDTPVEPGDKLSNRHGTKGVISRILPDDEMPHLADGTPVELVFSFMGLYTRMNFGQIREAVMGRIAQVEGKPVVVPPFQSPSASELRERLVKAGLPEDGMEILTLSGKKLQRPSTVGWVYWGRTFHIARDKIHTFTSGKYQRQGEMEFQALKDIQAFENFAEHFNTRAAERDDADTLAARIAAGPMKEADPPTPKFSDLVRRLGGAGIRAQLKGEKLRFRFTPPEGATLKLACPVPHPWWPDQELTEVGVFEVLPQYEDLVQANSRMERVQTSRAPERLIQKASAHLEACVRNFLDALLTSEHVRFGDRMLFSGRTVIAPGADLRVDQVGLAEQIAWDLFAPLVMREIGDEEAVHTRNQRATRVLDEIMARSWVLINRAPTLSPTSILAFHPVRYPECVIRLHPLACRLMNADFDGDQVAVSLPITEAAQCEAGERLSIAGHLERDPGLIEMLCPPHEAMWGLASWSLTLEGRTKIAKLAGTEVAAPEGFVTRETLVEAMRVVLKQEGEQKALETLERLVREGFEVAKASGASMSPFIGASIERPPEPGGDAPVPWDIYVEELTDRIASRTDFLENDLGPQLLAVKSGARGELRHLVLLVGARGMITDIRGRRVVVRHGYPDGMTPGELYAVVVWAREGLMGVISESRQAGLRLRESHKPKGFGVLARAMRAKHPGIVFAHAAAIGEADPLADVDSRLFVGLPSASHK